MVILSITEINKQRSRISLDTEESFVLYKGEIRMLRLKEGMDLSSEDYEKITRGILPKRCKMRAMNLLKERNYTVYGLKKKLLEGGYPEDICDDAIAYVASFGYVNDLSYAKSYIKDHESLKSTKEIKQKLMTKGVSEKIINDAFMDLSDERDNYNEESHEELEYALIKKTLLKKHFDKSMTYEDKQKILAYFYRRGFSIEVVRKAMDELADY